MPRLARAGYGAVVGAAVEPGAAMELKEDGVPWNVPMPKEGARVFTAWDGCKRGKTRQRKRRHGLTRPSAQGVLLDQPRGGSTGTQRRRAKQDGAPRTAGSGRQRGAGACPGGSGCATCAVNTGRGPAAQVVPLT